MEQRIPTIFEVAEEAQRQQKKSEPAAGQRKLKAARKPAARMSRRAPVSPKRRKQTKRKRR